MIIKTITVGELSTNCYLVSSDKTKETMIIDPGDEPDKIIKAVDSNNLKPLYIVNTHFHPDHLRGNEKISNKYDIPCYIGEKEYKFISDWKTGIRFFSGFDMTKIDFSRQLKDGEKLKVGDIEFEVIITSGHSPGAVCLYREGVVFTGDTLFAGDVGRIDLPGGSREGILASFKRLMELPDDTKVYPGHGPETTIHDERSSNVLSSRI